MVFLGRDYWTEALPVGPVLDALFATAAPAVRAEADRLVIVTDDIAEVADHLDAFTATESPLARGDARGFAKLAPASGTKPGSLASLFDSYP